MNGDEFWQYKTGIIPADLCTTNDDLNHSMLAIGFGIENEIEYALIQNQWGSTWGDNGSLKIELDDTAFGPCGLYTQSWRPLV